MQTANRLASATLLWLVCALAALAAASAHAQVGMASVTFGELPVTLVYPTAAPARPVPMGPFTFDVAMNAAPQPGRHPVVAISHGTGGSEAADHAWAASLARAGFVVAQPLHTGDNYRDTRLAGPDAWRKRPVEITQLLDGLGRDARWSGAVDLTRVGVHGMSAGGTTALSLAGAQWSTLNLVQHCNQYAKEDPGFCFNGATQPQQRAERQASYDRAKNVPVMFLPADIKVLHGGRTPDAARPDPRPDPRVAAVTLMVPVAAIFTPDSLARIRVPVGVVSAQDDQVLVPRLHSGHVLQHCRACTSLADLPKAGHFDVLWPWPPEVAREVAAQQVRGGSPNPEFDPRQREQAHARLVAFYRQHLMP